MISKEKRLEQLARYYNSDIVGHGYIPFIAKYLPDEIFSLLEVGVLHGASARMFDDFYNNEPEIHLIDLFGEKGHMTPRQARALGFVPFVGNQNNLQLLRGLPISYDIISEDASHNAQDQLITFKELFWGKLNSGGVYFMQDVHTSKDEYYWGDKVKSFYDTPLYMFQHYLATGSFYNPYFTMEDVNVFKNLIDTVEICADEKLIVIKKK